MQLDHSFTVPVGIDDAWKVLLDIERVAPCMPGAALETVDGDDFTGSVKVKLGPISLTYKGKASFIEKDEAAHRATIDAQGKDARGGGTAGAKVTATLASEGPSTTRVDVITDLNITGKPAQFGRGVMVDVGNKLIGQFADNLAAQLSTDSSGATTPAAAAPAKAAPAKATPAKATAPAASANGTEAAAAPAKKAPAKKVAAAAAPAATTATVEAAQPELPAAEAPVAAKPGPEDLRQPRCRADRPDGVGRTGGREAAHPTGSSGCGAVRCALRLATTPAITHQQRPRHRRDVVAWPRSAPCAPTARYSMVGAITTPSHSGRPFSATSASSSSVYQGSVGVVTRMATPTTMSAVRSGWSGSVRSSAQAMTATTMITAIGVTSTCGRNHDSSRYCWPLPYPPVCR